MLRSHHRVFYSEGVVVVVVGAEKLYSCIGLPPTCCLSITAEITVSPACQLDLWERESEPQGTTQFWRFKERWL